MRSIFRHASAVALVLGATPVADGDCRWFTVGGYEPGAAVTVTSTNAVFFSVGTVVPTVGPDGGAVFELCCLSQGSSTEVTVSVAGFVDRAITFQCELCTVLEVPNASCSLACLGGFSQEDPADLSACAHPVNDLCVEAVPVSPDGSIRGTTVGMSPDSVGSCGVADGTAGDVWFTVTGNGGLLTATTCATGSTFNTTLRLFTGDCGTLDCYSGNNNTPTSNPDCELPPQGGQPLSTVTWCSEPGVEYLLLLGGSSGQEGEYELLVTDDGPCSIPNNECAGATPIVPGSVTPGSTIGASLPDLGDLCSGTEGSGGALWYSITGDGTLMTASTWFGVCSGQGDGLDNMKLRVFTDGCGTLTCVASGSFDVTWCTEAGVEYLLEVHSVNQNGDIVVELCSGPPCLIPNDTCAEAIPVAPNSVTPGTNLGAGSEVLGTCEDADDTSTGSVWYSVIGTGTAIRATTCDLDCSGAGQTSFTTMIRVFSGDCGSLQCVTGTRRSQLCGFGDAGVWWCAEDGVEYFIEVHGLQPQDEGDFTLELCTAEPCPPANESCFNAVPMAPNSSVSGSTVGANRGGGFESGVAWYSIIGTGEVLTASTCPLSFACTGQGTSDFPTTITVFQGPCNGLLQVAEPFADDCASGHARATWCSQPGIEYFIVVSGSGFAEGEFTLEVCSGLTCPPPNDFCVTASAVSPNSSIIWSTVGATPDDFIQPNCSTLGTVAPGVWFTVVGTGHKIQATTCSSLTDFTTRLRILTNTCGSPICVGGVDPLPPDGGCPSHLPGVPMGATATWCGLPGVTYYIIVDSGGDGQGTFQLTLTELEPCRGTGACCLQDTGQCIDDMTSADCHALSEGMWMGSATQCAQTSCLGACCDLTAGCIDGVTRTFCSLVNGDDLAGAWQGSGSACVDDACRFIASPDGLWTALVGVEGEVEDLYRLDLGAIDLVDEVLLFEDNSRAKGLSHLVRENFFVEEGPVIDRDGTRSYTRLRESSLLDLDVLIEIENFMVSGPDGGVRTTLRWINNGEIQPIDAKLFYYADVEANATPADDEALPIVINAELEKIIFFDKLANPVYMGHCGPYAGFGIDVFQSGCQHNECRDPGLNCDLECGIAELPGDVSGFGSADHVAALSSPTVTLALGEALELHVAIGGENFSACPCPGDLDGDGLVSTIDFLMLLAAWGPNPGPADLDGNGTVDTTDFLALLAAWGPCP